ncbi:MAG: ABC transporter ATP-binding protein [Candidatus Neomarinimicrobiota bacterium]|jgi:ABC-type lipoprotein export system ATPase subunit|tara:strand:- start:1604 stop:2263 length:660 start_codon:yes stop_codon:yes gene_type:complete
MIIKVKNLSKNFLDGKKTLNVLNNISFDVKEGEIVTIKGPSGSGKSTLLSILGTLDHADSGEIFINNQSLSEAIDLNRMRNLNIGFVFQFHNLIPELSLEENVCMPKMISKEKIDKHKIKELFKIFELEDRMKSFPNDLSGGEKQRVAVMRAIVNNPSIVIADEPTGNLDKENAIKMIALFKKLNTKNNLTFIIATHDEEIFDIGHSQYILDGGDLKKI